MAVTFSLTSTGLTTIDFTDVTENIALDETTYVPVVVTPTGDGSIPPFATETLQVRIISANYNGYATLMQHLHALQKRASEYWVDQQQATPVWLNCTLDNETNHRRALVKAIHVELHPWTDHIYQECGITDQPELIPATLLIERHPYWEATGVRTFPNNTPSAAAAVAYDYTATADIAGDVGARVNALAIRASTSIDRLWLGIRSTTLHGADGVTNFEPIWEFEDGTNGDAEVADDGGGTEPNTASPGGGSGDYIQVTPVPGGTDWDDGDFHLVSSISFASVGYAAAEYEDAFGRFLFLVRCKVSAGEWEFRTSAGYAAVPTTQPYSDPVSVTNTSWDYKEAAIWTFGSRNRQAIEAAQLAHTVDVSQFHVYARRTSGAGNLLLDCVCLIPIDEGFLELPDANASTTQDVWFGQGPKEDMQVITTIDGASDNIVYVDSFEAENFRLPPGDGRIIAVYARDSSSVLTDTIEFADSSVGASSYTERWVSFRGSE